MKHCNQCVGASFIFPFLILKGTPMSDTNDTFNPFDPAAMLKCMRDANMETWSKMMLQLVNSEAYSKATGTMLDAWLTTSTPFRKVIEMVMTQVLTNLNMPTRADVTRLAERLTNIETRLDDLDARLEDNPRAPRKPASGPKPRSTPGENPQ
jgi:hypothetical protein